MPQGKVTNQNGLRKEVSKMVTKRRKTRRIKTKKTKSRRRKKISTADKVLVFFGANIHNRKVKPKWI